MYSHYLRPFITVVQSGSFVRAADKLFLTPTALIKQINHFEKRMGITLLDRGPKGVTLTPAGELIYTEALKIMREADDVMQQAKYMSSYGRCIINAGVSRMNHAPILLKKYDKELYDRGFYLNIIPLEDVTSQFFHIVNHFSEEIQQLSGDKGSMVDIIETFFLWNIRCGCKLLKKYPQRIAVSRSHRLAGKERITMEDLKGETLVMTRRGLCSTIDRIRDDIERNYPEIRIRSVDHMVHTVFFDIAMGNEAIVSTDVWKSVNPSVVVKPVEWDYTIDYGFVFKKDPPERVKRLLDYF